MQLVSASDFSNDGPKMGRRVGDGRAVGGRCHPDALNACNRRLSTLSLSLSLLQETMLIY